MSEGNQPEIVLNEFGELSRKAWRELLAKGIDPDTAVIEFVRTQSIPIVGESSQALAPESATGLQKPVDAEIIVEVFDAEIVDSADLEVVAEVSEDVNLDATPQNESNEAPVFAPSLSRRDMRNLRGRSDASSESAVQVADVPEVINDEVVTHVVAIDDEIDDDINVEIDVDVDVEEIALQESTNHSSTRGAAAPQTIAEATAAIAIAESIASRRRAVDAGDVVIDHRDDASEITEDYEPFSISTMSTQSTGIIPTTGSALILPTLPEHAPGALSSFNHTGEIILTGSIMLPSSMGQYGADVLSLDTSEIDIIADEEEFSSSQDLAPVSASSAVSAYNTSNTVVTVPSKIRDRLPLILAITAAGLAVGVVALFITGYVLGVF